MKKEDFITKTYKKLANSNIEVKYKVLASLKDEQLQLLLNYINACKVNNSNTNYMRDEFLSILVKKELKSRVSNKNRS